jgi:hypothetical protein
VTASNLSAHAFAPSLLEIREIDESQIAVHWRRSQLRLRNTHLEPILPPECRPLTDSQRLLEGSAVVERWDAGCGVGQLIGARVGVSGLERSQTAALVRIRFLDDTEYSVLLQGSEESVIVVPKPEPGTVIKGYTILGTEHILSGPDHLLFVLGLVLLITGRRRLVLTLTSFTFGHSITLALATLGWLTLPSAPVEVAIALSLVAVASELARGAHAAPGLLRRSPWLVAGGFGLLHGLGFAGALREVGLPDNQIPLALLSFNIGIELGQLLIVAVILAAGGVLRALPLTLPRWAPLAPAYAIGSLAAYWCLVRAGGLIP